MLARLKRPAISGHPQAGPEHQNRLFSLVPERRLQFIALDRLRYRWAAMNTVSGADQLAEDYTGSEAPDPALADRFALFVHAADWSGLKSAEQRRIADPSGEGRVADDGGALAGRLQEWRRTFLERLPRCPAWFIDYVTEATGALHIVISWAVYNEKTRWLPSEHWLARALREALTKSCRSGILENHGPAGTLLVRLRENRGDWTVEHLLITLKQLEKTRLIDLCEGILATLESAYRELQQTDPRWTAHWADIEYSINPSGRLLNGSSDGDNGQTGRKLVMD